LTKHGQERQGLNKPETVLINKIEETMETAGRGERRRVNCCRRLQQGRGCGASSAHLRRLRAFFLCKWEPLEAVKVLFDDKQLMPFFSEGLSLTIFTFWALDFHNFLSSFLFEHVFGFLA
jgi:hypothetical protein